MGISTSWFRFRNSIPVLFLLSVSFLYVHAAPPSASSCKEQIAEDPLLAIMSVNWHFKYSAGRCQNNICRLVADVSDQDPGLLKGASVLFIHTGDFTPFVPLARGRMSNSAWDYHVVLMKNKKIYDFDYKNSARAEPVCEYVGQMLPTKKVMQARVIPATHYLETLDVRAGKLFRDYLPESLVNPSSFINRNSRLVGGQRVPDFKYNAHDFFATETALRWPLVDVRSLCP